MNIFAKIFEVENHQVLIMKDETEDTYDVTQIVDLEEVRPVMTMGFETKEKRDDCFDKYSQKDAENFYNVILKMLNTTE